MLLGGIATMSSPPEFRNSSSFRQASSSQRSSLCHEGENIGHTILLELKSDCSKLQESLDKERATVKHLENQNNDKSSEIDKLKNVGASLHNKCLTQQNELETANTVKDDLRSKINEAKEAYTRSEEENERTKKTVFQLESKLAEYQKSIHAQEDKIGIQVNKIDGLMQRISDCDRKIISLQKSCEMYNQLYTKEKQDHEEKVAQLFKFQSDFEEHREKSRKDIDEVNVELQKTETPLTS